MTPDHSAAAVVRRIRPPATPGRLQRMPLRLIVADDHPGYRPSIGVALGDVGIDVLALVEDGVRALAAAREHAPDVALLDLRMPGLGGAEVARALAREGSATRVLILSAHAEPELVAHAVQAGVAGFVSKEASRREIVAAVTRCAAGERVLPPGLGS